MRRRFSSSGMYVIRPALVCGFPGRNPRRGEVLTHPKVSLLYRLTSLRHVAVEALEQFFADVQSGAFPGEAETYHMPEESAQILRELHEGSAELPGAGLVTDSFLADEAMEQ